MNADKTLSVTEFPASTPLYGTSNQDFCDLHSDTNILVTREVSGWPVTITKCIGGVYVNDTVTGKELPIEGCMRSELDKKLPDFRGTLRCTLVYMHNNNDGRQFSTGPSRGNNIKDHEYQTTCDRWKTLVDSLNDKTRLTLQQFTRGYFVFVCHGEVRGDDADERFRRVRKMLPPLEMDRKGVLRYPQHEPLIACHEFKDVRDGKALKILLGDIEAQAMNAWSSRTPGLIVNILLPNLLSCGVRGTVRKGVACYDRYAYKLNNTCEVDAVATAYDKNSNRFQVCIGSEYTASTPVHDDVLRNDLRQAMSRGESPRIRGTAIYWYFGYAEAQYFCISRLLDGGSRNDAPGAAGKQAADDDDEVVVTRVTRVDDPVAFIDLIDDDDDDDDAPLRVVLAGSAGPPAESGLTKTLKRDPEKDEYRYVSPADKQGVSNVLKRNCETRLGISWEHFESKWRAATDYDEKRALYDSIK